MTEEMQSVQKYLSMGIEWVVTYSFQILGALVIFFAGFYAARWLSNLVVRLCESRDIDVTLGRFFGGLVKTVVLVFVGIIVVGQFGISIAPFIAALGALVFGASFAIQGPLSNYGAGLAIILTRPFTVGDTVVIRDVNGVVEEITLSATYLTTEDQETISIPNKHVIGEILVNSRGNRIVETSVGISYDDDPHKAIAVLKETLAGFPEIAQDPPPLVGLQAFGDSAVEIGMRYWVPTRQYFQMMYRVNLAVWDALAETGISIPYPQQDVHVLELPEKAAATKD